MAKRKTPAEREWAKDAPITSKKPASSKRNASKEPDATLSVRISPELLARLRNACADRRASRSFPFSQRDVIEQLLGKWLERVGG